MPDTEPGNLPCLRFLQAWRLNLSIPLLSQHRTAARLRKVLKSSFLWCHGEAVSARYGQATQHPPLITGEQPSVTTSSLIHPLLNLPVLISCVNTQESVSIKRACRANKNPQKMLESGLELSGLDGLMDTGVGLGTINTHKAQNRILEQQSQEQPNSMGMQSGQLMLSH